MSNIDAEYQLYALNLGHLLNTFGRLENLLTSALKLHLALNIGSLEDRRAMRLASAIYGAMRFKAARDTIKRLMDADGAPPARIAIVGAIMQQATHIENLRDKLAHQLVVPAHSDLGAFWQVSDQVTTRDIKGLKLWVFDTTALGHASGDLEAAANLLGGRPVNDRLFSHLDNARLPAWRYKPSMLRLVPHSKLKIPPPQ